MRKRANQLQKGKDNTRLTFPVFFVFFRFGAGVASSSGTPLFKSLGSSWTVLAAVLVERVVVERVERAAGREGAGGWSSETGGGGFAERREAVVADRPPRGFAGAITKRIAAREEMVDCKQFIYVLLLG